MKLIKTVGKRKIICELSDDLAKRMLEKHDTYKVYEETKKETKEETKTPVHKPVTKPNPRKR